MANAFCVGGQGIDGIIEDAGGVLGQVRRLLASPELVARTITAGRRENSAAEDIKLEEGTVIEALGALEPVWDELYPAEQACIVRILRNENKGVAPELRPRGIVNRLHARRYHQRQRAFPSLD